MELSSSVLHRPRKHISSSEPCYVEHTPTTTAAVVYVVTSSRHPALLYEITACTTIPW